MAIEQLKYAHIILPLFFRLWCIRMAGKNTKQLLI